MEKLDKQSCPFCGAKTLTLSEEQNSVKGAGNVFILSMSCSSCEADNKDVEIENNKGSVKITFDIENEKDLKVQVVKSGEAVIKVPQMRTTIEMKGGVFTIEDVLNELQKRFEDQREEEDDASKKHAKNSLKKLRKVRFGDVPLKIIIEDPSGNSVIVSDKAVSAKLK